MHLQWKCFGATIKYETDCNSVDSVLGLSFANQRLASEFTKALTWYVQPGNANIAANFTRLSNSIIHITAPKFVHWLGERPDGVSYIHEARGYLEEIPQHGQGSISITFDHRFQTLSISL